MIKPITVRVNSIFVMPMRGDIITSHITASYRKKSIFYGICDHCEVIRLSKFRFKGNYVLKYKGENVTAIKRNGSWGFCCDGRWIWRYKDQRIYDLDTLKMAAFETFDEDE